MASTISAGVGRSGSPMPSEMTSTPAAFLAAILRSSSANRYGGIRSRRSDGCMQLLDELSGQLAPEHRDRPAGQVDVQVLPHLDLELAAVEAHGHGRVAAAGDVGDGRAAGTRARGQGLAHATLEDAGADHAGLLLGVERDVGA